MPTWQRLGKTVHPRSNLRRAVKDRDKGAKRIGEFSSAATNNDRSLSQITYHRDGISSSRIHELHQEHRRELTFMKLDATEGQTITYSSPPNFGNYVTKTKLLHQEPDHRASIILGEQYKSEMEWILCFPKNFLSVPFHQLRWLPGTERKFFKNFSKLFSIFWNDFVKSLKKYCQKMPLFMLRLNSEKCVLWYLCTERDLYQTSTGPS